MRYWEFPLGGSAAFLNGVLAGLVTLLLGWLCTAAFPQGILGKPKANAERVEAKAKPAAKEPAGAAKSAPSSAKLRLKEQSVRLPDWAAALAAIAEQVGAIKLPEKNAKVTHLPPAVPELVEPPAVRVEPGADTTIIFDTWPDAEVWLAVNPAKFPQAVSRDGLPYADRAWLSLGKVREWRARVGRGTAEMWLAASRADGTWTGALRVMVAAGETKTVKAR